MIVTPPEASLYMSSQKERLPDGSTPEVGSSRNRILGECTMAHASASLCRQPVGSEAVSLSSRPSRPVCSRALALRPGSGFLPAP